MSKSSRQKKKIPTSTPEQCLDDSPFSALDIQGLPNTPSRPIHSPKVESKPKDRLGQGERLEIRREKSGRGGTTVTTILGFPTYLGEAKKSKMLKTLKTSLGTGGTWNGKTMELQGDRRDDVYHWLKAAGFSPVLAGG